MPAARASCGRRKIDRLAVDPDLAGVGDHRARQALDQGRLAGAVVADDGQHLARVQVEVGAVEADDAAEGLDQAAGLDDRLASVGCSGGHARTLRIHWSVATATMTRTPIARV